MKFIYYILGAVVLIALFVFFQNNQNPSTTGMATGGTVALDGLEICDNPETYEACTTLAVSDHYDREAAMRQCIITAKQECYASYAIHTDNYAVCDLPSVDLDFAEPGEMQAGCYSEIGVKLKDDSICKKIDRITSAANREYEYCVTYTR